MPCCAAAVAMMCAFCVSCVCAFCVGARRGSRCMCNKKKAIKATAASTDSQTTTNTAMMTTTHNTNINTTQRKRAPEEKEDARAKEEEKLRNRWENRVTGALFRQLKHKVRAANALFGTPEWVSVNAGRTSWARDD